MKKLELKHLASYLPYELKWYHKRMDSEPTELLTMTTVQLEDDGNIDIMFDDEWISDMISGIAVEGFDTWVKPLLRPMSDLEIGKNWIDKLQEECNHTIDYNNGCFSDAYSDEFTIDWLPQICFEWLLKNHFDVFGLIDAGLAIDINTLNK